MVFFVLLLIPKVKKFELIQFQKTPEKPTVAAVLHQTRQLTSNPEFQSLHWIGLYCPQTETCLLLPNEELATTSPKNSPSNSSSRRSSSDKKQRSSTDSSKDPEDVVLQSPANTKAEETPPKKKPDPPSTQEEDSPAGTGTLEAEDLTETQNEDSTSHDEKKEDILSPSSVQTSDFPSPTASTAPTEPAIVSPEKSSEDKPNELKVETSEQVEEEEDKEPSDNEKEGEEEGDDDDKEDEDQDSYDPDQDESEIIPLEDLGLLLVAVPHGYKLKHVQKQAKKITDSPAFRILTQGQSMERPKKTPLELELEALKNASKAKQMTQQLQQHHKKNELSTAAYQLQLDDLEQRRQKRLSNAPAVGNPSPDSHGLSPLDQFRVQQSQQSKKAREHEQQVKASQAHHLDTSGRLSVTSNTVPKGPQKRSSSSSLEKADVSSSSLKETEIVASSDYQEIQDRLEASASPQESESASPSSKPKFTPTNFDAHGLSPLDQLRVQQNQQKAQQRQREQEWKPGYIDRDALKEEEEELKEFPENPFVASLEDDHEDPPVSSAEARQKELQAKKEAELEALKAVGDVQSKSKSYATKEQEPRPVTRSTSLTHRNRATKTIVTTSIADHDDNERPALTSSKSAQGLLEDTGDRLSASLHYIPPVDSKATTTTLSSSLSELKELQGLGLAKSLTTQFTESAQRNAETTEAFRAQQRDLEARKSKTTPFAVNRNSGCLSAADTTQLEFSKQKKKERVKEREAMGYYQTRKEGDTEDAPREWKTKGQVLTTQGTGKKDEKEWQATEEAKTSSATYHGTNTTTTGNKPKEAATAQAAVVSYNRIIKA
eukprot:CAMPEP_0176013870 /NCGR_PEP_ID=MMETSP0120_2-20121206/6529_1 /TAXON_ID=160619 /ORGANISM="Kryptoperidinium foliaceum, Strain CCMP 1326" /LENGTH=829 /DNA_ID=CAMNT_0017346791 /DNA_START=135 /DNA_END=2622 /DNA_ORIENTATION=-